MNQTCHTLSIIIPAYNEEKTIAELLLNCCNAYSTPTWAKVSTGN